MACLIFKHTINRQTSETAAHVTECGFFLRPQAPRFHRVNRKRRCHIKAITLMQFGLRRYSFSEKGDPCARINAAASKHVSRSRPLRDLGFRQGHEPRRINMDSRCVL